MGALARRRCASALAVAALLALARVGAAQAAPTYQNRTLPGRLIVNGPTSAQVYDLGTGAAAVLPRSGAASYHDRWEARAASPRLVRINDRHGPARVQVSHYGAAGTQSTGPDTLLRKDAAQVLPSPDGRYLLAYWKDDAGAYPDERRITVFDRRSGAIVKRHAAATAYYAPYALDWLPDGRYVYLDGKRLMVSAPGAPAAQIAAVLTGLPGPAGGASGLAASPDGRRIVFAWHESGGDQYLWTARLDGSGLRRLTRAPAGQERSPIDFRHGGPVWSPDGVWVAAVVNVRATTTAAARHDAPDDPYGGERITGTTGCSHQVVVLPAEGQDIALTWPAWDAAHGVKVQRPGDRRRAWLALCGEATDYPLSWVP